MFLTGLGADFGSAQVSYKFCAIKKTTAIRGYQSVWPPLPLWPPLCFRSSVRVSDFSGLSGSAWRQWRQIGVRAFRRRRAKNSLFNRKNVISKGKSLFIFRRRRKFLDPDLTSLIPIWRHWRRDRFPPSSATKPRYDPPLVSPDLVMKGGHTDWYRLRPRHLATELSDQW